MKKIELEIVALSHSVTQSANYAVVLGEQEGERRLPIVIGGPEAQAIAIAMERMTPNRPLTHDLFKNALLTFDIDLKEVIVNNLIDGIFHSKLVCVRNGEQYEIDSRTSDAIALAVRFDCPIYTYEFIIESAGIILETPDEGSQKKSKKSSKEKESKKDSLKKFSDEELEEMLNEVLSDEDYEQAAKIRDEITKRKGES
jgi:bifunctional DNase/RNase